MVALTLAAVIIGTVFTLGGASARHFQEQQRVAQLQLATRLALDRVRRDVSLAGLMATPDSRREQRCQEPASPVQAFSLIDDDAAGRAALATIPAAALNGVHADRLRLVGNYVTSDQYLVRSLDSAGSTAFLQTQWQGFRRSFAADANATTFDDDLFQQVFAEGRMLHLRTQQGQHFFVTVTGASIAGDAATVTFSPSIGVGGGCVVGLAEMATIAPITQVEYRIDQPLAGTPFEITGDRAEITGPNTVLVREELTLGTDIAVAGTYRAVLEWAVLFDVDVLADTAAIGTTPPDVRLFDDANAQAQVDARPGSVRSARITLAGRSPEQDPRFPWPTDWAGARPGDQPLSRFLVFPDRPGATRVRVQTTEVFIPNVAQRGM